MRNRAAQTLFFSPWFGMDPSDNLNLIQPVNPWSGSGWSMYTEYFQWSPIHNSNSRQVAVEAGQTLTGSLVYNEDDDSYLLTQTITDTGEQSQQTVKCQDGKKYTVPYVVYEKTFPCRDYPPDGKVTFHDIVIECDGQDCKSEVQWEAKVKDANCDMTAHIQDESTISITWDTTAASIYDNMTRQELFELNSRTGHWPSWGTPRPRPGGLCSGVDAVFFDMHDGDEKRIVTEGSTLTITPHGNNETWSVQSELDDNCKAIVDFNVTGKPSPPPVPLQGQFWLMSAFNSAPKLTFEFTDPSATIVPSTTQPLNHWVQASE